MLLEKRKKKHYGEWIVHTWTIIQNPARIFIVPDSRFGMMASCWSMSEILQAYYVAWKKHSNT